MSFSELQKTVANFFFPCRPTKGDAEKAKSSVKGRRSGHGLKAVKRGRGSWAG